MQLTLHYFCLFVLSICHTLKPSSSAGRGRGLKGSTHLSPVHAFQFGLADWVSTRAPCQLTTNKQAQMTALCTQLLTFYTVGIGHYEEKAQRIWNQTLDLLTRRAKVGPLNHQGAAAL